MQHQHEDPGTYIERLLWQGQIKLKTTGVRCNNLSMGMHIEIHLYFARMHRFCHRAHREPRG